MEELDVSVSILKLRSEVLNLLLKELYHYVALADNGIALNDLVVLVAYCLFVLGYHLISSGNCCLKLIYLSDVPIQLAMGDLCLTSQVDNTAAL